MATCHLAWGSLCKYTHGCCKLHAVYFAAGPQRTCFIVTSNTVSVPKMHFLRSNLLIPDWHGSSWCAKPYSCYRAIVIGSHCLSERIRLSHRWAEFSTPQQQGVKILLCSTVSCTFSHLHCQHCHRQAHHCHALALCSGHDSLWPPASNSLLDTHHYNTATRKLCRTTSLVTGVDGEVPALAKDVPRIHYPSLASKCDTGLTSAATTLWVSTLQRTRTEQ